MAINISDERSVSEGPGDPASTQGTTTTVPNETSQPKPSSQPKPQGKIQDDPVFRSLPRNIQVQVEAGNLTLDQAVQAAAKSGGGAGQPAPAAGGAANQPPAPPTPPQAQSSQPTGQRPAPGETPQSAPNRLSAGQVLEGGRSGRDTFARPGQQGFRAFQGQEFNPFLLRPEAAGLAGRGAALSARDALNVGDIGRSLVSSGGSTGFGFNSTGFNDDNNPFLRDILG